MKIKSRFVALTALIVYLFFLISPFIGLAVAHAANPFSIPENRPIPENIPIPENRPIPDNIPIPDSQPIPDQNQLENSSQNIPEGNQGPTSPFEAAKQTFKDILSNDLGIDPSNPRLEDINTRSIMAAFGEIWGYKEYLTDAAFTLDAAILAKDSIKGYKYYKYLKMHFKSPAEIKAAWNDFVKNGGFKNIKNASQLKGNLNKLGKFWNNIVKHLDVDARAKDLGKLKLFGPTASRLLGKFSPWMAAYDTATSGFSAIKNFAQGNFNQGFENAGHALMAGAVVLSASGVGAPVAAGVAAVGAVMWAGAKIWKHRETIGRIITNPVGAVKSVVNTVTGAKDFVSGVANKVSGAIDTVKGWFGR